MSTVGATNCAARMDMDLTDYGLRSIMDHDLDYDNNVFPPSPPHPQESVTGKRKRVFSASAKMNKQDFR